MARPVDVWLVYEFLRRLTTPFENTDAYKLGIIDRNGDFLKKRRELRTREEKKALGYFDVLVFNLKKMLAKVPGGRSRLATYAAAMFLIKEGRDINHVYPEDLLAEKLDEYLTQVENSGILTEDGPTVSAGSGNIAGIGVGPDGEPGLTRKQQKKHRKKNKDDADKSPVLKFLKRRREVNEAFDRPSPFKIEKTDRHTFTASSKIGPDSIGFLVTKIVEDIWEVSFYANGTTDFTNSGNPMKVFSTVISMLKKFVDIYDPKTIIFTGDRSKGRARLYDKMTKRFSTQYGFSVTKSEVGSSVEFTLRKK